MQKKAIAPLRVCKETFAINSYYQALRIVEVKEEQLQKVLRNIISAS